MTNIDDKAHAGNVGIAEILSDLQNATKEQLENDPTLDKYHQITALYDYIKPLIHLPHDICPNTAGTIAVELKDVNTSKTVSLVCFTPNSNKKAYQTEVIPNCSLVLGNNNPDGDCYAVEGSLNDGITLFMQNNMTDGKDDTIHVIFNKFSQTVKKLAENRKVKILTTADKKHDLIKSLTGANVEIYSTIQSPFIQLEQGDSLDIALEEADITLLQEKAMKYKNGYIESHEDGLYYITYDEDGEIKLKTKICRPLKVLARSRDINNTSWGIYFEWNDLDGISHKWAMPAQYLEGDGIEYRKELANKGLNIYPTMEARKAFDIYLTNHPTTNRAICVNQVGWYKDAYLLPDKTYNSGNQLIVYQPDKPADVIYTQKGTLEQWTQNLCKPLAEQSRIAFAISCAFAGQLLHLLGAEGGGFHIVGGSSMGKSIGLKVAGSVWGDPDRFIKRWRVTDNGLESIASTHNDSFLGLDEISEGDPKAVGNSAYMLANGQGKVRAKAGGGNRPTATWRLMFLSNGEKTLNTYLNNAGIEVNAGQLVRLVHIEADAGTGYRSFDSLVMADTAEQQATLIKQLSTTYYGTAGVAWLEYITKDQLQATLTAKGLTKQFLNDYKEVEAQAYRVAERFAIVATAGEMATSAGITGWEAGQATNAVKSCFNNWLENYGSDGNHEERQIIKQVQSFIEQHGSSRFQPWQPPIYSDLESKIINRVGWRKYDDNLYLFYTNAFKQVCGSFEVKKTLQVLDKLGYLKVNEDDRSCYKIELPDAKTDRKGKKDPRTRMYAVSGEILNYQDEENAGTAGTNGTPHINQGLERVPHPNTELGQMGQSA